MQISLTYALTYTGSTSVESICKKLLFSALSHPIFMLEHNLRIVWLINHGRKYYWLNTVEWLADSTDKLKRTKHHQVVSEVMLNMTFKYSQPKKILVASHIQ